MGLGPRLLPVVASKLIVYWLCSHMKVILPLVLLLTFQVQCNLMCLSEHDLDSQKAAAQATATAHHHHHSVPDPEDSHHGNGKDCGHPSFDNAENVQSLRLVHATSIVEILVPGCALSSFGNEPLRVSEDFHSPPITADTPILSLRI